MNEIVVEPLSTARMDDFLRFFDDKAFTDNPRWSGCYCYFPLHDPKRTDWRTRTGPENRAAIRKCISAGHAQGFLAYRDGEVIGWCNAGPHARYPMVQNDAAPDEDAHGNVYVRKSLV